MTIYEIGEDGNLSRDAEIYSDSPEVNDNFGNRFKVGNGLVAVRDGPLTRVYKKVSNSWQQQYEIDSRYGDFEFHSGELFVISILGVSRYQANNGVLLQTVPPPPPPAGDCARAQFVNGRYFVLGEKYLAHETSYFDGTLAATCEQGYYTTVYERDGSGNYQLAFTYKGDTRTYVDFVGDVVAISQGVDLSNGISYASEDVVTYYKNNAGAWLHTRQAAPWGDRLLREAVGEQMLYTKVKDDALVKALAFYSFNPLNGWTLDQQMELPSQFGTIGTETLLVEEGDRVTLVNSYSPSRIGSTTFPGEGSPTVTVLQRSEDGTWVKEFERTFEGDDQLPILVSGASTDSHSFVPLNAGGFLSIARVAGDSESTVDGSVATPGTTGGCDYTDASRYDGWGWNSVTGQSCPPVQTGPMPSATCVDTTPVGDGWGWDGSASCRVSSTSTTTKSCIDTSPVGDGWGWDGSASCRVSSTSTTTNNCIDTSPVGDGWGWNGSASCRLSDR